MVLLIVSMEKEKHYLDCGNNQNSASEYFYSSFVQVFYYISEKKSSIFGKKGLTNRKKSISHVFYTNISGYFYSSFVNIEIPGDQTSR